VSDGIVAMGIAVAEDLEMLVIVGGQDRQEASSDG